MTDQPPQDPHPGMLGDGTEEQNLNQPGDPSRRIGEDEVNAAFSEGENPARQPGEAPDSIAPRDVEDDTPPTV